ncbi:hypothetical protein PT276_02670 [Orbaceae bacterium ESL0721]|nr:hypothetical protein [Orbaceae bacterium ESL0721]
MKKVVTLIMAIFIITSCKESPMEEQQILLSNNYNILLLPLYTPNSEPINRQEIVTTYLKNDSKDIVIIEADKDGFITTLYTNNKKEVDIDYNNLTLIGFDQANKEQYFKLVLDDKKNIINIIDSKHTDIIEEIVKDNYGRVISVVNRLDIGKQTNSYHYNGSKLQNYYTESEYLWGGNPLETLEKTALFYNDKNELIKSEIKRDYKWNQKTPSNENINEEFKHLSFNCFFSAHNQYGDWTESYCEDMDHNKIVLYTRSIEY